LGRIDSRCRKGREGEEVRISLAVDLFGLFVTVLVVDPSRPLSVIAACFIQEVPRLLLGAFAGSTAPITVCGLMQPISGGVAATLIGPTTVLALWASGLSLRRRREKPPLGCYAKVALGTIAATLWRCWVSR